MPKSKRDYTRRKCRQIIGHLESALDLLTELKTYYPEAYTEQHDIIDAIGESVFSIIPVIEGFDKYKR